MMDALCLKSYDWNNEAFHVVNAVPVPSKLIAVTPSEMSIMTFVIKLHPEF